MVRFIEGTSSRLPPELKEDLYTYRYQVFVRKLGWKLDTLHDRETDEFDHDGAFYVIAKDDSQRIVGCARLLPTTQPYLLEHVFPELLNGMPPPKAADTWELSRFTSIDLSHTHPALMDQGLHGTARRLLIKALSVAREQGAERLISVSPVGIERLLRHVGIHAHRAGPPIRSEGHALIACWIDIADNAALLDSMV